MHFIFPEWERECGPKNEERLMLCASLIFEENASVWDQIANDSPRQHGMAKSRDGVTKKWYNLLCNISPRSATPLRLVITRLRSWINHSLFEQIY